MNDQSGIPIKKPTPALQKEVKIKFKDFLPTVGKAGIDAGLGNWGALGKDSIDILKSLGLSSGKEEKAWLLVYKSLLQAVKNLIEETTELQLDKFDLKSLQNQINQTLRDSSLVINQEFFLHPEDSCIVTDILLPLSVWLQKSDPNMRSAGAKVISQRLPSYFSLAIHEEWGNNSQDYSILQATLDTPFTQANARTKAWLRYSSWLQKQVEEPLFLEAFSLKQVFIPLRAYYKLQREKDHDETISGRNFDHQAKTAKIVIDLETELETWLDKADKNDAIRIISGGPGSGKSSLTKIWAAKLSAQGKIKVLFVPLHHFNASLDLVEAMEKFINVDGFLTANPLYGESKEKRLLIIFDGLDELAMQGKIAQEIAQSFVREVQRKVQQFNQREICLQILISGRELVLQANESDFRKEGQILHLLPYFLHEDDYEDYEDGDKLLEIDQRQLWWQKYGEASESKYTALPSQLDQGNLIEITAQPLLNYLIALSLKGRDSEFTEDTNLNSVYGDLLKAIYNRGWTGYQHTSIQGIAEKDFIRVLEEIALASWHGNGRTTSVNKITEHCESSGLEKLFANFQQAFQEDSQARSITRLLTAFYFRQSGYDIKGNETFEFTHKSFGEYLTARRIVGQIRKIAKQLQARKNDIDEGWDEKEALYRWALVCGETRMDEYLFNFINDEIKLEFKRDPDLIRDWQIMFCEVIGFMLKQGMPMERFQINFQQMNQRAINSEDALLAMLGICSSLTKKMSKVDFPTPDAFGTLLSRIQGQRQDINNPVSFAVLSYLDLSNCILTLRDFLSTNLEGAKLLSAHLEGANLEGANLSCAYLEDAKLRSAYLEGAHLEGAKLRSAHLRSAHLEDAHLSGANLEGANLSGANLLGANLERANLTNAEISNKQLKLAHNWREAYLAIYWDEEKEKWVVDEEKKKAKIKELEEME